LHADVGHLSVFSGSGSVYVVYIADEHTEARLEGCDI
jgi:hypothetical protein